MKICVVGTGYVGLVAGAGFADMGHDVVCCDIDAGKIEALRRGRIPIFEPGLDRLVARNVADERLAFSTSVGEGATGARVVFLAVGTPSGTDGGAELGPLLRAAEDAARALGGPAVLVTKSTVPVGTGDRIEALVRPLTPHRVLVASNPEFLKEGDAVNDFLKPDRVIVGANEKEAAELLVELYRPFTHSFDRIMVMDRRSAEVTKYAANAMLATRISFMNDLANLCEKVGADVEWVRKGMGADDRIGPKFLYPGAGFGGSCFPKDLRAIIATAREHGGKLAVLDAVLAVNEEQKHRLAEKVRAYFGGSARGKRVAVWGLAFKPGTDDLREAPSLTLIDDLLRDGAQVVATDPVALAAARGVVGERIAYEASNYDCAKGADALCLVTEWREYRRPNWAKLAGLMRGRALFDGRNVWDAAEARAAGFTYAGVGR